MKVDVMPRTSINEPHARFAIPLRRRRTDSLKIYSFLCECLTFRSFVVSYEYAKVPRILLCEGDDQ